MTKQHAAGYLAALIDGEGSVQLDIARSKRNVRIFNTDRGIIDGAVDACNVLGISYKLTNRAILSGKKCWVVWISGRDNLTKLQKAVELRSKSKRDTLDAIQESWMRSPVPTKQELQRMLKAGMTHREIADRLGYTSHSNAQYHLRRCGLL